MIGARVVVAVGAGLAALVLAACSSSEVPAPPPAPVLGWVVGDGCASTPERIRADADGLVAHGVVNAGYRTLYVLCDDAERPAPLDDRALHGYLDERGLSMDVVSTGDEEIASAMAADTDLPALRTAITRHVMGAEPLVFTGDAALLDPAHIATVTNAQVLAVSQDARRTAGAPIGGDANRFSRALGSQGLVVSLTNDDSTAREMSIQIDEVNLAGDDSVMATDVWTGRRIRSSGGALTVLVASTDSALLRIG
ncbi:hypothetical protein [Gordonia humi]|uniref:Alpha galactosidase C-terminal domain-containing protein n=1 Tax=Gordonia humi TaxID=686429 RepID=A0A840F100_9ACTN|nr:hypothetical protein [Gordonia humi]MBB4137542.1 hypothetical protein [Gordonia humi]